MLKKIHQLYSVYILLSFLGTHLYAQSPAPKAEFAQILFNQRDYLRAIIYLENKASLSANETTLLAESLYASGRLKEALSYFEKLLGSEQRPAKQREIEQRIFVIYVKMNDFGKVKTSFEAYRDKYNEASPLMNYAMGKMLFDRGNYEASQNILKLIPKKNEFFMRARYLIAVSRIDNLSLKESIELYKEIEKAPIISVEDYSVQQMAILSQARLYSDGKREDLAADVYERADVSGPMGERASAELIKTLLTRADMAQNGEGKFEKLSLSQRIDIEQQAISRAARALERYRKVAEVTVEKPELYAMMALLYAKSKRYDEARISYATFIGHYRTLYEQLLKEDQNTLLWPYFKINSTASSPIKGVPLSLFQSSPEFGEALYLKKHIEDNAAVLERISELDKKRAASLRIEHQNNVRIYEEFVLSAQKAIKKSLASLINDKVLADAEFKRAELALAEMQDLQKQIDVTRQFQSKTITQFERELPELEGGPL